jgi:hypothetical protein
MIVGLTKPIQGMKGLRREVEVFAKRVMKIEQKVWDSKYMGNLTQNFTTNMTDHNQLIMALISQEYTEVGFQAYYIKLLFTVLRTGGFNKDSLKATTEFSQNALQWGKRLEMTFKQRRNLSVSCDEITAYPRVALETMVVASNFSIKQMCRQGCGQITALIAYNQNSSASQKMLTVDYYESQLQ